MITYVDTHGQARGILPFGLINSIGNAGENSIVVSIKSYFP